MKPAYHLLCHLVLAATVSLPPGTVSGQQGSSNTYSTANTDLYNQFKSYGDQVPVPKKFDTLDLGTFNNATGEFEGFGAKQPFVKDNAERTNIIIYPKFVQQALETIFKVRVSGNMGETTLVVNTHSTTNQGEPVIYCKGSSSGLNSWEIISGGKRFKNKVQVYRLPVVAIGALTLDHLPVAIVYHPPPGEQKQNYSFYANKKIVNSVVSFSKQSEESTTTPALVDFEGLDNSMRTILQLGNALKLNEEPGSAVSSGIDFLSKNLELIGAVADAIGEMNFTETVGSVTTEGLELKTSEINEFTLTTMGSQTEQGLADRFYFLLKPRFLWTYYDGVLKMTYLDHHGTLNIPGHQLKEDPRFAEVARLNPFLKRRNLDKNRYEIIERISLGDGSQTYKIKRGNSQLYTSSSTKFKTEVADFKPGFLGMILGGQTSTLTTKLSQSRSVEQMTAEEILSEVNLVARANESLTIDVFFDKLFGTLAFQQVLRNQVNEANNPANNDINGVSRPVTKPLRTPSKPGRINNISINQTKIPETKPTTKPTTKPRKTITPKTKSQPISTNQKAGI